MKNISLLILAFIFALILMPAVFGQGAVNAGKPFITNFYPNDYGAGPSNWAIVQDHRGVIYIGNENGVLEYDGSNWELIQLPNKSVVRSLGIGNDGTIYVGGVQDFGYLAPDEQGRMQFVSFLPDLPVNDREFEDVWETEIADDGVYFTTNQKLFRWSNKKMRIWRLQQRLHVSAVLDGIYHARLWEVGLTRMEDDTLKLVPGGEQFASERIYVMLPYDQNKILIGTRSQGLYLYNGKTFSPFKTEADGIIKSQLYLPGVVLADGSFALNTTSNGLVIINRQGKLLHHLTKASGINDNTVRYVFPDRQGGLWLGHGSGLSRVEILSPSSLYEEDAGLEFPIYDIIRHNEILYVATNDGVYWKENNAAAFKPVNGISSQCYDLLEVNNRLFATALEYGLFEITGDQAIQIRPSVNYDFRANQIIAIGNNPRRLFVLLDDAVAVLKEENGQWVDEGKIPGSPAGGWGIEKSSNGNIWTGAVSGCDQLILPVENANTSDSGKALKWIDQIKIKHYDQEDGLPAGYILLYSISGKIYAATNEGLYSFQDSNQMFAKDTVFNEVTVNPLSFYYFLKDDAFGRVWINLGFESAVAIPQADGSYQIDKKPFLRFADLKTSIIYPEESSGNAISTVWFGGSDKLVRYNPTLKKDFISDYPALIRKVILGEDSVIFGGTFTDRSDQADRLYERATFSYSDNTIRLQYAAPTYDNPGETRFQTMLEGFDKRWSAWTPKTEKEFINLPPGNYRFRVQAKNIYQHLSEEAAFEFKILPPWYSSWWAYLFYVLAAGGIVFALVRMRTKQVEERSRELEKTVEMRTEELRQKVNELAIINSVGDGLAKQLEFQAIIDLVGDKIQETFQVPTLFIAMHNQQSDVINLPYYLEQQERIQVEPQSMGTGLISHVMKTRQPLLINENAEARFAELGAIPSKDDETPKKSWLGVPILVGKSVTGVISLQDIKEHAFSDNDLRLLSTLASNMGVALENARLFDETNRLLSETQQRSSELAVINTVQEGLVAELNIQAIYDLVGSRIQKLFDAQVVVIRTYDQENGQVHYQFVIEKGKRFYVEPGKLDAWHQHLIDFRKPKLINKDFVKEVQKYTDAVVSGGEEPKSAVFVPMIVSDVVKGNISLQNVDRENAFSETDVRLLTTLANSMSVALENARLFDETNQRAVELSTVNSISQALAEHLELGELIQLVGEQMRETFKADIVYLALLDKEANLINFPYFHGDDHEPLPLGEGLTSQIILNKEALLINEDVTGSYEKYGIKETGAKSASYLGVPISVGKEVIGVISVQTTEVQGRFDEDDKRLLSTIAANVGAAIHNAQLFEETSQRAAELATVNDLSQALSSKLDLDSLVNLVGDQMRQLFQADIVYVALHNKETDMINFQYEYGDKLSSIPFGQGLTSRIIESGKPLLINEDMGHRHEELDTEQVGVSAKSYLGVPIPVGKDIIGVISVQSTQQESRFRETDMRLLGTIASGVGVAIQNARLFEDAKQARAIAEEANEAKSAFLSTVSHELRTPLTSVLGFAKIIKKRLEDRIFPRVTAEDRKTERAIQQISDNIKVVVSEGERLTALINNVLDLAKIEAGKIEWNMETVTMPEIVERATAATASLFEDSGLALTKQLSPELPELTGDRDKLIQVVINLISNAVKFTDEGSVTCIVEESGENIVVSIKDTGMGISPEDQPRVFEKFKQVGDTLTDKPKGTGLGLPICKEIVEYHGGKIWVKSEPGKGSTFSFSLPLKSKHVAMPGSDLATFSPKPESDKESTGTGNGKKSDGGWSSGQKIDYDSLVAQIKARVSLAAGEKEHPQKILIVDDEKQIRNLLQQEFREAGFEVDEAADGKDALEKVRSEKPDLIILDVMMPEMNGFDVAAVLKNDPETMDIPIIILSIVQDKERGYRLGVDRYLTKPIDTEILFKEVDSLLTQGKSHKKVLVVDEDASTAKTLMEVLSARGYHVAESNGEELVKKAISEKPDIIILNTMLSDKQEIVKSLRFEKGLENVLFLMFQ